jgi:DNA replication protein DnaC
MAMSIAKFPAIRTLEDFDFSRATIDRSKRGARTRHESVGRERRCGSSSGPPGVGRRTLRSHLAGKRYSAGIRLSLRPRLNLIAVLAKAQADGRLEERLSYYTGPKLLIIDELGYLPLEKNAANLFFQLISRRYEKSATLITTNRSVNEWGEIFGDVVVAAASLTGSCIIAKC